MTIRKIIWIIILFTLAGQIYAQSAVTIITADELELALNEDILLVDVRFGIEFDQGHIPGATHVNLYSRDFVSQFENINRSTPVYVYCKSGHRSLDACQKLEEMGFTRLYSLKGGTMAWRKARKPFQTGNSLQ
jgi:phage shock protein E